MGCARSGPIDPELWSGMSSVSLPVTRPAGRALVVGHPGSRGQPLAMLRQMGFSCAEANDPYAAMTELCRNPSEYKALILSLAGVYSEELELIPAIKRNHPAMEIWVADAEGRQAALGEAMRQGADGLVGEDGLHRIAMTPPEGRARGATAAAELASELSQLGPANAEAGGATGADNCAVAAQTSPDRRDPHDRESDADE